jgi:MFS family permease
MASNPAIQAYVADTTSRQDRTGVLASMASAQGFGAIIGPGLAPLLLLPLVGLAGPQLVFGVAGLALMAFVALHLPRDTPKVAETDHAARKLAAKGLWKDRTVWPFVLYMTLLSACSAANIQTLGFVVIDTLKLDPIHAQPYAGGAIMGGAIGGLVVQLVVIRTFRLTPPTLMLLGAGLAVAGNLLMAAASGFPAVAIAFALTSIGYAFGRPGVTAGASLSASAERQGAVAGLLSGAGSSGLMASPILAMSLYHFWRAGPFLALALVMGTMLALAAANRARPGRAPTRPSELSRQVVAVAIHVGNILQHHPHQPHEVIPVLVRHPRQQARLALQGHVHDAVMHGLSLRREGVGAAARIRGGRGGDKAELLKDLQAAADGRLVQADHRADAVGHDAGLDGQHGHDTPFDNPHPELPQIQARGAPRDGVADGRQEVGNVAAEVEGARLGHPRSFAAWAEAVQQTGPKPDALPTAHGTRRAGSPRGGRRSGRNRRRP